MPQHLGSIVLESSNNYTNATCSVADFPDLEIPLDYSDHSFVVMYTDASNSTRFSGLGAILIDKSSRTRLMSQATVPQSILRRLADEITAPINHLEILAMLCALITFRRELRGRKIYWGVDNDTALSAALYGYAPSQSMKPLVNALHIAMAHLSTRHPLRVRAERRYPGRLAFTRPHLMVIRRRASARQPPADRPCIPA